MRVALMDRLARSVTGMVDPTWDEHGPAARPVIGGGPRPDRDRVAGWLKQQRPGVYRRVKTNIPGPVPCVRQCDPR